MVSDRYNYLYTPQEIGEIFRRIEQVRPQSERVFAIFHNDPEAHSLINGFQLRHLARRGQRVLVPQNFVQKFPLLKEISAPVNVFHPLFAESLPDYPTGSRHSGTSLRALPTVRATR